MKKFIHPCPICQTPNSLISKHKFDVNKIILQCNTCLGLSLHPSEPINYSDSKWTDKRIASWDADVKRANVFAPKIRSLYTKLTGQPLKSILEIGCGSGYMGKGFENSNCKYLGTEIDTSLIAFGKNQGLNIISSPAESINTAIPQQEIDLVISSNVFEHLINPQLAFAAIAALKPQISIIIVPNPYSISGVLKTIPIYSTLVNHLWHYQNSSVFSIDGMWHNIAYSKQTLTFFANKNNFEVISLNKISTNDSTLGFVQPCTNPIYNYFTMVSKIINMPNLLCLISRHR